MKYDIVSLITFLPLLGVPVVLWTPQEQRSFIRNLAFAFSLIPLVFLVQGVLRSFDYGSSAIQFENRFAWIGVEGQSAFHVQYHVGIDGLSLAMVMLVSILTPLVILGTSKWIPPAQLDRVGEKPFLVLILVEQTGLYGAFTALNFFHWFIFWEASLVPMFFLIKLYGHEERTYAAYQFFVYTFVGSVAMFVGMQFVYLATNTWDFTKLADLAQQIDLEGGESVLYVKISKLASSLGWAFFAKHAPTLIFGLVFIGFAVKAPLWPFHTWLPLSYTHAPTAGSMLMTGLMSKMGVYGLLRVVLPLFYPTMVHHSNTLMLLAVATIWMGAWAAFVQQDLKKIISYSSISHLGYCLLGIFAVVLSTSENSSKVLGNVAVKALTLDGVIVQMFAHGLSGAGLFYCVGLLERRAGSRQLSSFGGLRKGVPLLCGLMGILIFASLGLPGLGGFVGEWMIFQGVLPLSGYWAWLAVPGILLTALYLLRMLGDVFFGPVHERWAEMPDLTRREKLIAGLLAAMLFVVGVVPGPLIQFSNFTVTELARRLS